MIVLLFWVEKNVSHVLKWKSCAAYIYMSVAINWINWHLCKDKDYCLEIHTSIRRVKNPKNTTKNAWLMDITSYKSWWLRGLNSNPKRMALSVDSIFNPVLCVPKSITAKRRNLQAKILANFFFFFFFVKYFDSS